MAVTIGAIRRAKLQTNQTDTCFFTGQMPFLSPNPQCRSTEGKAKDVLYKIKYKIPY